MNNQTEGLRATISPELSDKLYTLATEYSVSTDLLVNLAAKRLIADVELIRSLRSGSYESD